MDTPVVFIAFNRPSLTKEVLECIRRTKPSKLFVVCDGARQSRPQEDDKVSAVRRIIANSVDWSCEVYTNYAGGNLGCRERPASGINWVFSMVEEAIFLEDDCLPNESFFVFCAEMLKRYRNDERVMHVNGTNFIGRYLESHGSYFFSKYIWVWGWATWRRAWRHYDYAMTTWETFGRRLNKSFDSRREQAYWTRTFDDARRDWRMAQAWDFSWIYSCWTRGGLAVTPSTNLVENLGFGSDATHTTNSSSHLHMRAGRLESNRGPVPVRRSRLRDDMMFRAYAGEVLSARTNIGGALRVLYRIIIGIKGD
jgi:hypothetical protein